MRSIVNLFFLSAVFLPILSNAQAGSLDPSLDPGSGPAQPAALEEIVLQPDGKIVGVGGFLTYNGDTSKNIFRVHPDGSRDLDFIVGTGFTSPGADISGSSGRCEAVALQPDGKILVAGAFTSYDGTPVNRIARLWPDGTIDTTFVIGTGFNGGVQDMLIQPDGKIVCGGSFTSFNGTPRQRLCRLHPDGALDTEFTPAGVDNTLFTISLQPDGKLLVAGTFTTFGTTAVGRLARVMTDGALDTSFIHGEGAGALVTAILVMADERILISGGFTSYDGQTRERIAMLQNDGTLDAEFNETLTLGERALTMMEDSEGRIVITGNFLSVDNIPYGRIARLHSWGGLDVSFNAWTGFANTVRSSFLQPDGRLVAGGYFTSYSGTPRIGLARINMSGTVDVLDREVPVSSIHPNPVVDQLFVNINSSGTVQFTITDMSGRMVQQGAFVAATVETRTLEVKGLPAGVYVMDLMTAGGRQAHRFIKE
jgi:uncharacterized delta-60 repeat protein